MPALALAFCAALPAQEGRAGDETMEAASVLADSTLVAATERFSFHSTPWLNLHHFLYQWARGETERAEGDRRRAVEVTEKAALVQLGAAEQGTWRAAVDHYSERCVARYLTFNTAHHRLKVALLEAGRDLPAELPYDVSAVLTAAMPIYRRVFWPEHDRQNRAWIAEVVPLLHRHERAAGERLARAMGGEWPTGRLRVDASCYANWAGAYTTQEPDHVMVASASPTTRGWNAFELMMHEPCHTAALGARLRGEVRAAFRSAEVEEPTRLWHALIFYTAGEVTRDVVPEPERKAFRTYAEAAGFWESGAWKGYREVFDAHWRPCLRGDVDRDKALGRIARAVGG